MSKRILVIEGTDPNHFFLSSEAGKVLVGDGPSHPEAFLKDLKISRIRCEVEVEDDRLLVCDPPSNSNNLNRTTFEPRSLSDGQDLNIGHLKLHFEALTSVPAGAGLAILDDPDMPGFADDDPATIPAASTTETIGDMTVPDLVRKLMVVDGADAGRTFLVADAGITSIGKSARHADIALNDLYVSRHHCELRVEDQIVTLHHVEGTHGTLLNGVAIKEPTIINPGDKIRVGNSHLCYVMAPAEPEEATLVEEAEAAEEVAEAVYTVDTAAQEVEELKGKLLGHFKVGEFLGHGFYGMVFKAEDQKHHQTVALKVLHSNFPATAEELDHFIKAMTVTPALRHAHLLSVFGAGRTKDHCWIAREWVDGDNIENLAAKQAEKGKFEWKKAARVGLHLAQSLAFLHAHKVVHGNLTPHNIYVRTEDKSTKLSDLMLTQALRGSVLAKGKHDAKFKSELPYLAPEQTSEAGKVTLRSDLYGLGAVMYLICTGHPPFEGSILEEVVHKVQHVKPPKPTLANRKVPDELEKIIMKLLAKDPAARYSSATELVMDLEPIISEHEVKV